MKEYLASKKHFIPTLIVSGALMFIAGIIVNSIGSSKRAAAALNDTANVSSHLFEDYIVNLGVLMLYFGLAMVFIAGLWLLYFLFTMNTKSSQAADNSSEKTVNVKNLK